METVVCPSCERNIHLEGKIELGQHIRCPNCDEELEVIEIHPLELDWPYEEKEWTATNGAAGDAPTSPLPRCHLPDTADNT